MTEGKALVIIYASVMVATAASIGALAAVGAKHEWMGLAVLLIIGVGADTVGRVTTHYASSDRRHR